MDRAVFIVLVLLVSGCASTSIVPKQTYSDVPPEIKNALVIGGFYDRTVSGMAEGAFQRVFGEHSVSTSNGRLSQSDYDALGQASTKVLGSVEELSKTTQVIERANSAGFQMVVLVSRNPVSDKSSMRFRARTDIGGTSTYNPYHEITNQSSDGGYAAEDPREQLRVVLIQVSPWKIAWAGSVVSDIRLNEHPEKLFDAAFATLKKQIAAGLPNNSLQARRP